MGARIAGDSEVDKQSSAGRFLFTARAAEY
jgi:hypothetical protein